MFIIAASTTSVIFPFDGCHMATSVGGAVVGRLSKTTFVKGPSCRKKGAIAIEDDEGSIIFIPKSIHTDPTYSFTILLHWTPGTTKIGDILRFMPMVGAGEQTQIGAGVAIIQQSKNLVVEIPPQGQVGKHNEKVTTKGNSLIKDNSNFIAVIYDSNTKEVTVLVNNRMTNGKVSTAAAATNGDLVIKGADKFDGAIACLKIFPYALTENQVLVNKYCTKSK